MRRGLLAKEAASGKSVDHCSRGREHDWSEANEGPVRETGGGLPCLLLTHMRRSAPDLWIDLFKLGTTSSRPNAAESTAKSLRTDGLSTF